jgi:hypothetical protein
VLTLQGDADLFIAAGDISVDGPDGFPFVSAADVTLDADANVSTLETVLVPVYTTVEKEVQVKVDTIQVADGTVLVPEVTWVATQITEQVGTERVVVGSSYQTMDVALQQIGYFNPNAPDDRKFVEVLIEGVHYLNDSTRQGTAPSYAKVVAWSNAGNEQVPVRSATAVTGDYASAAYKGFAQLNDAQKWAVFNSTGYMPLYDFTYSNWKLNQTINGTASALSEGHVGSDGKALYPSWKPGGVLKPKDVFFVDVANWRDKYILMPVGAQEAILSVASSGEAKYLTGDTTRDGVNNGTWNTLDVVSAPTGEYVGQYLDVANVQSVQNGSAFTSATLNGAVDFDGKGASWQVSYASGGQRSYQLTNGLASTFTSRLACALRLFVARIRMASRVTLPKSTGAVR